MPKVIITDASCLIALDKIEALFLLQKLYHNIYVTDVIAQEYGNKLPDFVIVENPQNDDFTDMLVKNNFLDLGEATAIALAKEKEDSLLIIDEYKGRRVAKSLGIKITGTIGVLGKAKNAGLINKIKPYLEKLEQSNFRIDSEIIKQALIESGEE